MLTLDRVVPHQVEDGPVLRIGGRFVQPLQPQPQVVHEPQLASGVAVRFDRLVVPLQHSLGVGEAAVLLGVRSRREEEHLGPDVLRPDLSAVDLGGGLPELGRLVRGEVADDHPLGGTEALSVQSAVHRANRGVLAHDEISLDHAVGHGRDRGHVRVVAVQPREVLVAPMVRLLGGFAEIRLHQRHEVRREVVPVPGLRGVVGDVAVQAHVVRRLRHR